MTRITNFVRRWWGICLFVGMISGWNEVWGGKAESPIPGIENKGPQSPKLFKSIADRLKIYEDLSKRSTQSSAMEKKKKIESEERVESMHPPAENKLNDLKIAAELLQRQLHEVLEKLGQLKKTETKPVDVSVRAVLPLPAAEALPSAPLVDAVLPPPPPVKTKLNELKVAVEQLQRQLHDVSVKLGQLKGIEIVKPVAVTVPALAGERVDMGAVLGAFTGFTKKKQLYLEHAPDIYVDRVKMYRGRMTPNGDLVDVNVPDIVILEKDKWEIIEKPTHGGEPAAAEKRHVSGELQARLDAGTTTQEDQEDIKSLMADLEKKLDDIVAALEKKLKDSQEARIIALKEEFRDNVAGLKRVRKEREKALIDALIQESKESIAATKDERKSIVQSLKKAVTARLKDKSFGGPERISRSFWLMRPTDNIDPGNIEKKIQHDLKKAVTEAAGEVYDEWDDDDD